MSDYCSLYHCAGDCGKRHGPTDKKFYKASKVSIFGPLPAKTSTPTVADLGHHRRKKLVLAAFDELKSDQQRKLREQRAAVERKARTQL